MIIVQQFLHNVMDRNVKKQKKFIGIVLDFSWDIFMSQEKLQTMIMQNVGWGGGGGGKRGILWDLCKQRIGIEMMKMFYLLFSFQQQQLQHSQQQQMQQIQQPPQHSPPQNTSPSSTQHTQPQAKQGGAHHLEQQPQPARPQTLSPHAESIWGSGTSSQASPCKCHSMSLNLLVLYLFS